MARKQRNGLEYLLEEVPEPEPELKPPAPVVPVGKPAPAAQVVPPKTSPPAPQPRHLRIHPELGEAREHSRRGMTFDVLFERGDEHVPARGSDLSRAGMFVSTRRALPTGAVVSASVQIEHRQVKVIAEVIWSRSEEPHPGMGLKFLDIEDSDADFLEALVSD